MIIPSTSGLMLALLIISALCWGSWANTFKAAGKWRFELFAYDFAAGFLVAAVVAAYTFGSFGNELSFSDDLLIASKRNEAFAFIAGGIFNLANMLFLGAIAIAGLSMAFPVAGGLALIIGVGASYVFNTSASKLLVGIGCVLVLAAIVVDMVAHKSRATREMEVSVAEAQTKPAVKKRRPAIGKAIAISILSGILLGGSFQVLRSSMAGGLESGGLAPYAAVFLFAIGVFLSTFFYNIYFLNLPIQGKAIGMSDYLTGSARQHVLGLLGGAIWCIGSLTDLLTVAAPKEAQPGPAVSFGVGQMAALIGAIWGVALWKEFGGANSRARILAILVLLLLAAGIVVLSAAA